MPAPSFFKRMKVKKQSPSKKDDILNQSLASSMKSKLAPHHRLWSSERSMFSDSSSTTTGSEAGFEQDGYIPVSVSDLSDHAIQGAPNDGQGHVYTQYKGQLKLNVYVNYGLLTVHVVMGRQFMSKWNATCDAYVKLSLVPDETKRTRCKTEIIADSNSPVFDEKFSFELLEEDVNKRLFLSVWHRDARRKQCEFLGCMSFGIQSIQEQKRPINGWYYLLTGDIGKKKHLAVPERKLSMHPGLSERSSHGNGINSGQWEVQQIAIQRGRNGFGFSISGANPVIVSRVDNGCMAERCGLRKGDSIIKIDGLNVSRSSCESVARIIRHALKQIVLEVQRPCHGEPIKLDKMEQLENSPRKLHPVCQSTPASGGCDGLEDLTVSPWSGPPPPPSLPGYTTRDYGWLDTKENSVTHHAHHVQLEHLATHVPGFAPSDFKAPAGFAYGTGNTSDSCSSTTSGQSGHNSAQSAGAYSSMTLPRNHKIRASSRSHSSSRSSLQSREFTTKKDYGWVDERRVGGTDAHGTGHRQNHMPVLHEGSEYKGRSKELPQEFRRPYDGPQRVVYGMTTLPRGHKKVSFEDFI